MGSSDEPGSNAREIDGSVGGLVWVRRRNGSWWPGRILGQDEITEGSLVSPRLGTPVKLLGREDASVDWYNLEKSKRVKAFRCGEYDDCIEKARANAATGNKKSVKYARREDAILHALEIENDRLEKDHIISLSNNSGGDLGSPAEKSPSFSNPRKEENNRNDSKKASNSDSDSDSAPELSQSGLSFEEPARVSGSKAQYVQGKRRKTPNDSEDDGTEKIKRMRGLEDLGMVVGDSNCVSNGSQSNGVKRKRSQVVANVQEFLKRKNRRRPLTKVLESTAVIPIPVICDQVPNKNGSPLQGLSGIESNESRKSVSAVANNNSDSTGVSGEIGDASLINCKIEKENDVAGVSEYAENEASDKLFNVPFVGDEKISAGFSPVIASSSTRHEPRESGGQYSQSSQAENASLRNNIHNNNKRGSTNTAATHINNINPRMEKSTSKWQSKGKRNSRHTGNNRKQEKRKYISIDDNPRPLTSFNCNLSVKSELLGISLPSQRSLPLRQSRFIVSSRYQASEFPGRTITESNLYDVKLEVKANYQPQNVPLVSLMSKLNGKAIVGRPLPVELLADGHCDLIVSNTLNPYPPIKMPTKITRLKPRFSQSKSKRRRSGNLSKKIRKLSSLTSNKEESEGPVVKKEKGDVIECVPLTVVFSRISEALNGSARQMKCALTSNGS